MMSVAMPLPAACALAKRSVSASYKNTCVLSTAAASLAMLSSWPKAKSNSTSTEGPPFMCDNCSKADVREISGTSSSPVTMSFKKAALTPAALVVPGRTLYTKKSKEALRSGWLTSLIWSMMSFNSAASSMGLGCKPSALRSSISWRYVGYLLIVFFEMRGRLRWTDGENKQSCGSLGLSDVEKGGI